MTGYYNFCRNEVHDEYRILAPKILGRATQQRRLVEQRNSEGHIKNLIENSSNIKKIENISLVKRACLREALNWQTRLIIRDAKSVKKHIIMKEQKKYNKDNQINELRNKLGLKMSTKNLLKTN